MVFRSTSEASGSGVDLLTHSWSSETWERKRREVVPNKPWCSYVGEEGRGGEERRKRRGGRGEERRGAEKGGRGGRGAEKGGYLKWKGHLKKGAVLHGANNQTNISCQRLHFVEAHDYLHLHIWQTETNQDCSLVPRSLFFSLQTQWHTKIEDQDVGRGTLIMWMMLGFTFK